MPAVAPLARVRPEEFYRVAKGPDPWEAAPYEDDAEPPRNRFDDPDKTYRVLYAASRPRGCFIEILARFRRSAGDASTTALFERELSEIDLPDDRLVISGIVPTEWVDGRVLGAASCNGTFADVYHSSWNHYLVEHLGHAIQGDFDLGALLRSERRDVTQRVSQLVWGHGDGFDGIRYLSRWGYEIECWALFQPFRTLHPTSVASIDPSDSEFQAALSVHNLRFGLTTGDTSAYR